MKCPCCNKYFSLLDYIKSMFIKKNLIDDKLPEYVTDKKGNLHPWYDKKMRELHSNLLKIHKSFNVNNTSKRFEYFKKLENIIDKNTGLRNSIWMCDNIWNGHIFIAMFWEYDYKNSSSLMEFEIKKIMKDGRVIINVTGDESYIKPESILKIIEIVNNIDSYLMLEELVS